MSPLERTQWLSLAALLGAAIAIAVVLGAKSYSNRDRLPRLTAESFHGARQRWRENEITDYEVTIVVTGRQAATYWVQVRDGQVVHATHNGDPLRQRRTLGTWSVPGMFDTIALDVDNVEKVANGTADRSTPQLALRGLFDPDHGFPIRYHRTENRKWSSNYDLSWEVSLVPLGDGD